MTYRLSMIPNLTYAGCTRQNRPDRGAFIVLGLGSPITRAG